MPRFFRRRSTSRDNSVAQQAAVSAQMPSPTASSASARSTTDSASQPTSAGSPDGPDSPSVAVKSAGGGSHAVASDSQGGSSANVDGPGKHTQGQGAAAAARRLLEGVGPPLQYSQSAGRLRRKASISGDAALMHSASDGQMPNVTVSAELLQEIRQVVTPATPEARAAVHKGKQHAMLVKLVTSMHEHFRGMNAQEKAQLNNVIDVVTEKDRCNEEIKLINSNPVTRTLYGLVLGEMSAYISGVMVVCSGQVDPALPESQNAFNIVIETLVPLLGSAISAGLTHYAENDLQSKARELLSRFPSQSVFVALIENVIRRMVLDKRFLKAFGLHISADEIAFDDPDVFKHESVQKRTAVIVNDAAKVVIDEMQEMLKQGGWYDSRVASPPCTQLADLLLSVPTVVKAIDPQNRRQKAKIFLQRKLGHPKFIPADTAAIVDSERRAALSTAPALQRVESEQELSRHMSMVGLFEGVFAEWQGESAEQLTAALADNRQQMQSMISSAEQQLRQEVQDLSQRLYQVECAREQMIYDYQALSLQYQLVLEQQRGQAQLLHAMQTQADQMQVQFEQQGQLMQQLAVQLDERLEQGAVRSLLDQGVEASEIDKTSELYVTARSEFYYDAVEATSEQVRKGLVNLEREARILQVIDDVLEYMQSTSRDCDGVTWSDGGPAASASSVTVNLSQVLPDLGTDTADDLTDDEFSPPTPRAFSG